jgi:hypothetical protein
MQVLRPDGGHEPSDLKQVHNGCRLFLSPPRTALPPRLLGFQVAPELPSALLRAGCDKSGIVEKNPKAVVEAFRLAVSLINGTEAAKTKSPAAATVVEKRTAKGCHGMDAAAVLVEVDTLAFLASGGDKRRDAPHASGFQVPYGGAGRSTEVFRCPGKRVYTWRHDPVEVSRN